MEPAASFVGGRFESAKEETMKRFALACALLIGFDVTGSTAPAQSPTDIRELKLRDWEPHSMLITQATEVALPAVPVLDVHNHLGGGAVILTHERVEHLLAEMDAAGVRTVVNLDGGWDRRLRETLVALDEAHLGRFLTFALLDFEGIDDPGWSDREVRRLEEGFRAGAKGLKIHKTLGLGFRFKDGRLVPVDDPKLDPIWAACGKFKKPVLIHTADPGAFFTPLDRHNERWHELNAHPLWLFHGDRFPARAELHAQRNRVIGRHPETTFICAHLANDGEDLAEVGRWLDTYPNMIVEFGARISELGRQPYSARRFLIRYQDRVLFGSDTPPDRAAYRMYYRFLETDDEYFDPAASHHRQGFWMIYGVFLPRGVLEKVYHRNAEQLLLGPEARR
jgi:predicted TIM-barrel fold metal-dependent hydrolase